MQKNNRSDRKHGTFRKYGLPPIDTPEETSAIPLKNEAEEMKHTIFHVSEEVAPR